MTPISSLISLFLLVFFQSVYAGSADYIYTPKVEYGEREVGIHYGIAAPVAGKRAQVSSLGIGYGLSENWFSELYLKQTRNGGQQATLAEWENKFQLTETGKYPIEMGLLTELEIPISGKVPWEFRFGPLLQAAFGKLQLNGNLLFERAFGRADEDGVPFSTNMGYQWQAKYPWRATFGFGLQGFGEVGTWNSLSAQAVQNHRVGPAIFGKLHLGNQQSIKYNAAWLVGASAAAPNHILRTTLEYEF